MEERSASLRSCRDRIGKSGIAGLYGDTLKKHGISVNELLHPSAPKDLKKTKFFLRVSFCPCRARDLQSGYPTVLSDAILAFLY